MIAPETSTPPLHHRAPAPVWGLISDLSSSLLSVVNTTFCTKLKTFVEREWASWGLPPPGWPPSLWLHLSAKAQAEPSRTFRLLGCQCERDGRRPGTHVRQLASSFCLVGDYGNHPRNSLLQRCCVSIHISPPDLILRPEPRLCSRFFLFLDLHVVNTHCPVQFPARLVVGPPPPGFPIANLECLLLTAAGEKMNCFQGHFFYRMVL